MSDEKSQQQTSTESTVAGAAKTGKAISNIAKGAAAGGAHGAAIEAGKSSAKWLIPLIAAVLLPLILVAMLPSIIFGSLLGDGTDSPNGISNDEVLVQNMTAINEGISSILSEGLTDVLERIDSDFASSGCDGKEINNPFGADVVFNANAFVSQYCAHKDTDIASISKEDNPKCRELQLDYYRLLQTIGSREAITRRFLVIFEYEAVTNRKPEYSEIVSALETTVQTARQYFLHCDNAVVTHDDEHAFLLEILYTIFSRSTCEVKTVEQRIGELQLARRDTDITVPVSLKSVLAPDSIDLTHGSYVVMDGVYHAYLIVPSDGYNPRVVAGWTSILVNAGEGIDVDFYFSREPKERIQAKLGQQIRINRSRLKDTSDTNSDFDDFESAIRSGYFLKEGLANYEDFYYCNTLVTVTADTLENLEWRISEVRRLMISQDMDIRICRFRQEQALLSILPFCKLDKKLFEASKRNMLTSSAASCYPFTSFEMSDENGILLGVNQHNNSLVIVDIFNSRVP